MNPAPVSPALRLLAALEELADTSDALARDPVDPRATRARSWALRLAERALQEAGGMDALDPETAARAHALAARTRLRDAATARALRERGSRLRHGLAELVRREAGRLDIAT